MRRAQIVLLLAFLPAILPTKASAWTRVSDERIAKKSAALAPPDLRLILDHFDGDYRHGIERAQAEEGADSHHFFVLSRQGQLRERIEKETAKTIEMIRNGSPMSGVAERLGTLAHLVADANNPFHVANDDSRLAASHNDFEQYFEQKLAKFPTVFYGLAPRFRLAPYLDQTFARTAKFYPLMTEEYFRGGERRTSASFDDHSTAFGVASVCYSRAVTDLVNLYYYIWKEAGGDVRSAAAMQRGNLLLNAY
jgi:hypothetical protein